MLANPWVWSLVLGLCTWYLVLMLRSNKELSTKTQAQSPKSKSRQNLWRPRDLLRSLERQLPTNRAGRFSKNAETPSTKSFVFPASICASRSRSS